MLPLRLVMVQWSGWHRLRQLSTNHLVQAMWIYTALHDDSDASLAKPSRAPWKGDTARRNRRIRKSHQRLSIGTSSALEAGSAAAWRAAASAALPRA